MCAESRLSGGSRVTSLLRTGRFAYDRTVRLDFDGAQFKLLPAFHVLVIGRYDGEGADADGLFRVRLCKASAGLLEVPDALRKMRVRVESNRRDVIKGAHRSLLSRARFARRVSTLRAWSI